MVDAEQYTVSESAVLQMSRKQALVLELSFFFVFHLPRLIE